MSTRSNLRLYLSGPFAYTFPSPARNGGNCSTSTPACRRHIQTRSGMDFLLQDHRRIESLRRMGRIRSGQKWRRRQMKQVRRRFCCHQWHKASAGRWADRTQADVLRLVRSDPRRRAVSYRLQVVSYSLQSGDSCRM